MKDVTVAIPHSLTTKWLQIVITSLKAFKTDHKFDVLVLNNSPSSESIKGITETGLSEGVRIVTPPEGSRNHPRSLDYAIDIVDTPYLFTTETDCRALKDNWIDNYFPYMKDDYVAMVGWFWKPGYDRHYINPSATLYSMNILKKLKKETLTNDSIIICYGTDLKRRFFLAEKGWDRLLKNGDWGPFSEQRGYQEIFHFRNDKYWQEPGAWLYFRAQCEYECAQIPGIYETYGDIASATWYGDSKEKAYYVHYWGGTVSHNWEWLPLPVSGSESWQIRALPYWIDREDRIWKEVVDERVRTKTLEMGLVKTGEEEKQYILNHPNVRQCVQKVSLSSKKVV